VHAAAVTCPRHAGRLPAGRRHADLRSLCPPPQAPLPALHPTDAAARAAALARLAGVARGHAAGVARGTALEALGRCSAGLLGDAGDLGADGAPATMRGRRELDELLGTAGASAGRSAVAPVSPAWFYGRIKPG